jgi:prevent-host-death family protein
MLRLTDVRSLTDFKRRTPEAIEEMKRSGRPQILTVNGRAELVVQDVASYQRLLDLIERAEAIEGVRLGLESAARGEGRPVDEVFSDLRATYGVPDS